MELSCPSCAAKHDTANYPDAFEIQCACGYSILVPDEAALEASHSAEDLSAEALATIPTSVEAEDEALKIAVPQSFSLDNDDPEEVAQTTENHFAAMNMTPAEDLPDGMLYDPLELPENLSDSVSDPAPPDEKDTTPTEQEVAPPLAQNQGQNLVEQSLLAHVGQFLGEAYALTLSGLSAEGLKFIETECSKFLMMRPWLEEELKRRGIQILPLTLDKKISNVPEILAIELYLYCAQLGGLCEFKKQSTSDLKKETLTRET